MDEATIRARLLAQKEEFLRRVNQLDSDLRRDEPVSADFAEQVTERENLEVMQALNHEGKAELRKINRALERLDKGEYTLCSRCGDEIAPARLQALPTTDLCIRCASEAN